MQSSPIERLWLNFKGAKMIKIGKLNCIKDTHAGIVIISGEDFVGNKKEYTITPHNFKNEAEQILWTMVNDVMEDKDKPTYEEAIEQKLEKTCKICGNTKLVGDFNRNKLGKYGARPECKVCQ